MTLKDLSVGSSAVITAVGGEGALRQHFLDMGMIPGAEVTVIKYAPLGDPVELSIHGYTLTLRLDDAAKIDIRASSGQKESGFQDRRANSSVHPGFGEGGKFHPKGSGDPLPDGTLRLHWLGIKTAERPHSSIS